MSPDRRLLAGGGALVALAAAVGALAYPELPAEMATHWNASGEVDGTTPRPVAVALLPALAAALLGVFLVLPRVDPRNDYAGFRFAYDALALATLGCLAYVHAVLVAVNLGVDVGVLQAVAPAVGGIYVVAGYVTERADQNWFVGVRTPWTLEDEDVWAATNRLVGALFKAGGVVAALGFLVPSYAVALVVAPAAAAVVVSVGYSYHRYHRAA
ncbi:SdpI family protein [Halobacterium yunchengense]|uniref:SdpI family protein n=1 Tax=Halobacterium yunchengense TaxID=3108497 RepID=UPI00300B85FE